MREMRVGISLAGEWMLLTGTNTFEFRQLVSANMVFQIDPRPSCFRNKQLPIRLG